MKRKTHTQELSHVTFRHALNIIGERLKNCHGLFCNLFSKPCPRKKSLTTSVNKKKHILYLTVSVTLVDYAKRFSLQLYKFLCVVR